MLRSKHADRSVRASSLMTTILNSKNKAHEELLNHAVKLFDQLVEVCSIDTKRNKSLRVSRQSHRTHQLSCP